MYSFMELKDIMSVVEKINGEILEQIGEQDSYVGLDVVCNENACHVKFSDFGLWYSEEDEREWMDDGNGDEEQEPFEPWLRARFKKLLDMLSRIEIKVAE